ncbi:MAG: sialate O-acetylesterase [Lentisphaerae bacterium]|nr:sialate O-acetylesterase [Lentisphaerota bacterium]
MKKIWTLLLLMTGILMIFYGCSPAQIPVPTPVPTPKKTIVAEHADKVSLPAIFSDHAVLQRSTATAVFGTATPGKKVTVTYGNISAETVAGKDGKFIVRLDLSKAGNDSKELIVAGKNKITVKDVIVGEVWFCTGQSNMAMRLRGTLNSSEEIKNSANSRIRTFSTVARTYTAPQESMPGKWLVASPQTAGNFTAVGYYFAKKLNQETGLAVGLINPAWGGSSIESWTCAKHLENSTAKVKESTKIELDNFINYTAKREAAAKALEAWQQSLNWVDDNKSTAPPADAKWSKIPSITAWHKGAGIYWLRRELEILPKDISDGKVQLWVGRPNVPFKVYWDGKEVLSVNRERSLDRWPIRAIVSTVPGKHTVMIRVSAVEENFVFSRENHISGRSTAAGWEIALERAFPAATKAQLAARPKFMGERPFTCRVPSQIYNGLVYPIRNYSIKGTLWYQGESNAGAKGPLYGEQFKALVKCFRDTFQNPDMPFYAVQLPDHQYKSTNPNYTGTWPIIREGQSNALKELPFAGEITTFDLGESSDIHPINKRPVGERLAAFALNRDYGRKDIVCDAPAAVKAVREKNSVRVTFTNCHGGLVAKELPKTYWVKRNQNSSAALVPNSPGSQIQGFTLCGADGKWFWANAKIEGNDVIVSTPKVAVPVKVRYAYQNNPTCNLFNGAGLPAGAFALDVK